MLKYLLISDQRALLIPFIADQPTESIYQTLLLLNPQHVMPFYTFLIATVDPAVSEVFGQNRDCHCD